MTDTTRPRTPRDVAIVIGGSVGGSTVAAALRNHYDRVVVLDRDNLQSEGARKGAPHAYQFHALTHRGREAMEGLFPGVTQEAIGSGVPKHDPGHTLYGSKYGFFKYIDTEMTVLLSTRIKLESLLRNRAKAVPGIEFIENCTVTGLRTEDGAVNGVFVESAGRASAIDADFVVDVSGRGSNAPTWLEDLDYQRPEETHVNAGWGYVTTYVRPGPDWRPWYNSLYVTPAGRGDGPRDTRGAGAWIQEDGLWVLTAQGLNGDYPPNDEEGFKDFLGSFGRKEFLELLDKSEIVRPLVPWRNTTNRLRDYANLPTRPQNFVVLGDAVAAFNPVYGQGMSAVSMQAEMLRDEMTAWIQDRSGDLNGFGEHFQKAIDAGIIQPCWAFSAGADLGIPGVEVNGEPHIVERSQEEMFVDRVLALATEDQDIAFKVWEMVQIIRGPEWMSDPEVQAKVMENWDRLGEKARDDSPVAVGIR